MWFHENPEILVAGTEFFYCPLTEVVKWARLNIGIVLQGWIKIIFKGVGWGGVGSGECNPCFIIPLKGVCVCVCVTPPPQLQSKPHFWYRCSASQKGDCNPSLILSQWINILYHFYSNFHDYLIFVYVHVYYFFVAIKSIVFYKHIFLKRCFQKFDTEMKSICIKTLYGLCVMLLSVHLVKACHFSFSEPNFLCRAFISIFGCKSITFSVRVTKQHKQYHD